MIAAPGGPCGKKGLPVIFPSRRISRTTQEIASDAPLVVPRNRLSVAGSKILKPNYCSGENMRLYLVQHGEANPEGVDPSRGLSEKGKADVKKVAEFLKTLQLCVKAVWQSGKTRATQTAELLAQSLVSADGVVQHAGLAPLDSVHPIREEVEQDANLHYMIVGHLPFMGKLASLLVAGSEDADVVAFQMGGVVCLERDDKAVWRVLWMVTPNMFV